MKQAVELLDAVGISANRAKRYRMSSLVACGSES